MNRLKISENSRRASLQKGSGLVEILVAVFIITIILGSLVAVASMYLSNAKESLRSTQAAYLASEGIEAVKTIRDTSWDNITALVNGTDYYLYFDNNLSVWKATTTKSSIGGFSRILNISSVYRDSNYRIILSGGTIDTNTKKVTAYVSWNTKNSTTTKYISTYITNFN
jgi:Tfp pilus assembly protein PilV